jgi:hypothetical protein
MLRFDEEGSPMWNWKFRLLIDGKPFEALIHSFTREGAIKRLNVIARKGELHAHYIRDVRDLSIDDSDDLYDDAEPSHKEYICRVY